MTNGEERNSNNSATNLEEIGKLKDEGNEYFKCSQYDEAMQCYTGALKSIRKYLSAADQSSKGEGGGENNVVIKELRAALYKNRAAVYLKKEDFTAAERDATRALDLFPNDSKSLFRRAQAREQLGNHSDAFADAKLSLRYEPNNKSVLQLLQRLAEQVQKKQKESSSTENRVNQMFQLCFEKAADSEKRLQAMNNLLVLARENAGASLILEKGGAEKLMKVIMEETQDLDDDLLLSAQRVVDELARDENRAIKLIDTLTVEKIVGLLNQSNVKQVSDSASLLIQRCFNALANMDPKNQKKPDEELVEKNKVILVRLIFELKRALTDPNVRAIARNNVIDLLLKNLCHMDGGLPRGWSWEFNANDGLERMLRVACNVPEQCTLPVTHETRDHVAICLARLYEDTMFDKYRSVYTETIQNFIVTKMENPTAEVKVEICALITALLLGPFDIGFTVITSKGMTEMLLQMADSDNHLHQSVALEAIVQTASKRERCTFLANQGLPVLKRLYRSTDANVRARALVGLCKVAASSGSDPSMKPVAEGTELKLAEACKNMLLNASLGFEIRRWAADGLAYLTLDAEVKEWLVKDSTTIQALVLLARQAGAMCIFGVSSIFVNLTNMYEKPNFDPEMKRLAQFAKHHVPEEHPLDSEECVKKRVDMLVKEGAVAACVAIANTESQQCREMLSRALFAFARDEEHRGAVVQEGGAKVLVKLALNGTEAGRTHAAQALAKIGATINPEIAFPGQRMYEIVKPMVALLHFDRSGLQNYEALLTLTNLASLSDSVRLRIFKERALPKVEEYWYMQDHKDLRAAAAELYLNLLHTKEVREHVLLPNNDRLKLFVLYSGEEDDPRLNKASVGAVAILTQDPEACKRIDKEVKSYLEVFKELVMHENPIVQHRGMVALANMMESDYDIAAKFVQTDIVEILIALTKMSDQKRQKAIDEAKRALAAAEKWELIKATDRELFERANKITTVREEQ